MEHVSQEQTSDLHLNVSFAVFLSTSSVLNVNRTDIKNAIVGLLNMENPILANEISEKAVSYYETLGTKSQSEKFVDVSTGN
jgi:hypothetical protein